MIFVIELARVTVKADYTDLTNFARKQMLFARFLGRDCKEVERNMCGKYDAFIRRVTIKQLGHGSMSTCAPAYLRTYDHLKSPCAVAPKQKICRYFEKMIGRPE